MCSSCINITFYHKCCCFIKCNDFRSPVKNTAPDKSLCKVCHTQCKDLKDIPANKRARFNSVACERCGHWYHFWCVDLKPSSKELKGDWFCPDHVNNVTIRPCKKNVKGIKKSK